MLGCRWHTKCILRPGLVLCFTQIPWWRIGWRLGKMMKNYFVAFVKVAMRTSTGDRWQSSSWHVRELYLRKNSKDGKRGIDNSVWKTLAGSDTWRIQLLISSTGWGFGHTSSWHVRELYLRNMDQNYFNICRTISERWERTNWGWQLLSRTHYMSPVRAWKWKLDIL